MYEEENDKEKVKITSFSGPASVDQFHQCITGSICT